MKVLSSGLLEGGHRTPEKLLLYVEIPAALVGERVISNMVPLESYLLSYLSPIINDLSKEYVNTAKNVREKAQFSAQTVNEHVIKRNGMVYDSDTQCFIFKINFTDPL